MSASLRVEDVCRSVERFVDAAAAQSDRPAEDLAVDDGALERFAAVALLFWYVLQLFLSRD